MFRFKLLVLMTALASVAWGQTEAPPLRGAIESMSLSRPGPSPKSTPTWWFYPYLTARTSYRVLSRERAEVFPPRWTSRHHKKS
jgi:hypothetical protein